MHDHRLAADISEGLAGQTGRAETGRNEDERIGHGTFYG
jgi:hypothetical protein